MPHRTTKPKKSSLIMSLSFLFIFFSRAANFGQGAPEGRYAFKKVFDVSFKRMHIDSGPHRGLHGEAHAFPHAYRGI